MLEIMAAAIAIPFLLFMMTKRVYALFFVILLTTEFFYIQVGGGVAHPYHFLSLIYLLVLFEKIPKLFKSKVFLALIAFVAINLGAVALSDTPDKAFASFLSLCANIGVSMATALILLAGKIKISSLKRTIIGVTLISIPFGILQIFAFRFAGIVLALSSEQVNQISLGFGPAFRNEANTFGKYMVFPFLLFLPEYIESKRIKKINLIILAFIIGILMNFTRTSIYGMGITFLFILIWYLRKNKFSLLIQKGLKIGLVIAFGIFLMLSGVLKTSEYAQYKINNFFNQEEITSGGSSNYRINSMQLILDDSLSSTKKTVIGNGWGQTPYDTNTELKTGAGDIVDLMGYSGILGVFGYLFYTWLAFKSASTVSASSQDQEKAIFATGVTFALVGIFCTAQFASYLIAPEYWMLIGLCIFLSVPVKEPGLPILIRNR